MNRLFEESQVKLMLDESIWSEEDLIRACSPRCAHLVKLKLMKHASPEGPKIWLTLLRTWGLRWC